VNLTPYFKESKLTFGSFWIWGTLNAAKVDIPGDNVRKQREETRGVNDSNVDICEGGKSLKKPAMFSLLLSGKGTTLECLQGFRNGL